MSHKPARPVCILAQHFFAKRSSSAANLAHRSVRGDAPNASGVLPSSSTQSRSIHSDSIQSREISLWRKWTCVLTHGQNGLWPFLHVKRSTSHALGEAYRAHGRLHTNGRCMVWSMAFLRARWFRPLISSCSLRCAGGWKYLQVSRWHLSCCWRKWGKRELKWMNR